MGEKLQVARLHKTKLSEAYIFLEHVFTREQQIPKHLIPPTSNQQEWWCIIKNGRIIATVAAWKINNDWHWGRLAVDPVERGKGLSKKLALVSFTEIFNQDIEEVVIDARDVTVQLLKSFGAKVTGPVDEFYGHPITPMVLRKEAFKKSKNRVISH